MKNKGDVKNTVTTSCRNKSERGKERSFKVNIILGKDRQKFYLNLRIFCGIPVPHLVIIKDSVVLFEKYYQAFLCCSIA